MISMSFLRRRQVTRLWYVIVALSLVLATTVAAGVMIYIAWQDASSANQQAAAIKLGQRAPTEADAPAIRNILRDARAKNYRFSSLIVGITTSAPFQMRRSQ